MLSVLREAGYDNVWDEPCYRYSTRTPPPPNLPLPSADDGAGVVGEVNERGAVASQCALPPGSLPQQPPQQRQQFRCQYVLDALRSEADARLVDSLWTYRSPYSLPLVRLLVAHRHTACVRLPAAAAQAAAAGSSSRPCRSSENAATAAGASGAVGAAADHPAAGPGSRRRKSGSGSGSGPESESGFGSDAVAWILQYADGSLGMAHTLPAHRRNGLMRRCVAAITGRVLRLGPEAAAAAEGAGGEGAGEEEVEKDRGARGGSGDGHPSGMAAGADGRLRASAAAAAAAAAVVAAADRGGSAVTRRQLDPEAFTFIVRDNTASQALFEGLGFRREPLHYHWFGVTGSEEAEEDVRAAEQQQQQRRRKQ